MARRDRTDDLVERALAGERRALGRLLSLVERGGEAADEITHNTHQHTTGAHVIGVTGAPGAGKSTLTGQLVAAMVAADKKPAVLAVDPSSPLSGGAILGDRVRMDGVIGQGAFIRSMATRGHQGGLALAVPAAVRLYDACGFDPVVIETVGVGQVEVDVAAAADTTVVVVTPGWGDAVQANKAGLLEVADVFVVNKADRPGANDARRDLELMLDLSHVTGQEDPSGFRPEIVMTTATDGTGANEVLAAVDAHLEHLRDGGRLAQRRHSRVVREVRDRVSQILEAIVDTHLAAEATEIVDAAAARSVSPAEAADRIVSQLVGGRQR